MSEISSFFTRKSLLLIFTYAPVGFGHLRVTDALYHGLPKDVSPVLLGSQDQSITFLYRLLSIHPVLTNLMERSQHGVLEGLYATLSRNFYRSNAKLLFQQLETIIDERIEIPETVLVVSTHFALAHQIASIKERFSQKRHVRIILAVQVTDDSPQQIWFVPGADIIFVPSLKTKERLVAYGRKMGFSEVTIEVNPYPVSPLLSKRMIEEKIEKRKKQGEKEGSASTHIAIPLSGAAVGLNFFETLIDSLHLTSDRYRFHVVGKDAKYTKKFLGNVSTRSYVQIHSAYTDRIVLDIYEQMYQKEIISIEVTKPSEQAFKSLLHPTQVGGPVMLFTKPVGRQEYDNLAFLHRHELIPTLIESKRLWDKAKRNEEFHTEEDAAFIEKMKQWRGLLLPEDPILSSTFIHWAVRVGIIEEMLLNTRYQSQHDPRKEELRENGVEQFWGKTEAYLKSIIS
jgi:hypothetical protein